MIALEAERQRIDRWLWHARLARTRPLAATLAASGHVRVNGLRVTAPARAIRIGDVLTVALPSAVRVLRVRAFTSRRNGAKDAQALYEDLMPPHPEVPREHQLVDGGSPTKRERRSLRRMLRGGA